MFNPRLRSTVWSQPHQYQDQPHQAATLTLMPSRISPVWCLADGLQHLWTSGRVLGVFKPSCPPVFGFSDQRKEWWAEEAELLGLPLWFKFKFIFIYIASVTITTVSRWFRETQGLSPTSNCYKEKLLGTGRNLEQVQDQAPSCTRFSFQTVMFTFSHVLFHNKTKENKTFFLSQGMMSIF